MVNSGTTSIILSAFFILWSTACSVAQGKGEDPPVTRERPLQEFAIELSECEFDSVRQEIAEAFSVLGMQVAIHRPYHPVSPETIIDVWGRTGAIDVLTSNIEQRNVLYISLYAATMSSEALELFHAIKTEVLMRLQCATLVSKNDGDEGKVARET